MIPYSDDGPGKQLIPLQKTADAARLAPGKDFITGGNVRQACAVLRTPFSLAASRALGSAGDELFALDTEGGENREIDESIPIIQKIKPIQSFIKKACRLEEKDYATQ